jgi:hypothetical protein
MAVRAAGQTLRGYLFEPGRTVVNCNPNCNPGVDDHCRRGSNLDISIVVGREKASVSARPLSGLAKAQLGDEVQAWRPVAVCHWLAVVAAVAISVAVNIVAQLITGPLGTCSKLAD